MIAAAFSIGSPRFFAKIRELPLPIAQAHVTGTYQFRKFFLEHRFIARAEMTSQCNDALNTLIVPLLRATLGI